MWWRYRDLNLNASQWFYFQIDMSFIYRVNKAQDNMFEKKKLSGNANCVKSCGSYESHNNTRHSSYVWIRLTWKKKNEKISNSRSHKGEVNANFIRQTHKLDFMCMRCKVESIRRIAHIPKPENYDANQIHHMMHIFYRCSFLVFFFFCSIPFGILFGIKIQIFFSLSNIFRSIYWANNTFWFFIVFRFSVQQTIISKCSYFFFFFLSFIFTSTLSLSHTLWLTVFKLTNYSVMKIGLQNWKWWFFTLIETIQKTQQL